jgi:GWxTD domain-containing protein
MTRPAAGLGRAALLAVAVAGTLGARALAAGDPIDLLNLALSPELATWLVGPNARLATREEEREFLALTSDAAALDFVERFWAARDPDPRRPGNPARDLAEERALEADRRFGEVDYPGRRTDRGTIFVLYGEPEKIEYEPADFRGDPPVEIWSYGGDAGPGLDARRPERRYRFVELDGEVVFYRAGRRLNRRPMLPTPPPHR